MQTTRIVQAVILMMVVALAASCAASKEYTSKLFAPRIPVLKDSTAVALKFLELDSLQTEKDGWVTTDIIKGKDTTSQTLLLDNLAKTIPAAIDTTLSNKEEKIISATADPFAKNGKLGEVRTKKIRDK